MMKINNWKADGNIELDDRRVVILDDDPTGTQTVSGVRVILYPSISAFAEFFSSSERAVYVLTNTRAMSAQNAVALLRNICTQVREAALEADEEYAFLLRGDSTLRGHIFVEVDVLASEDSVTLFVPAFPEGGRVTVNGTHYLQTEAGRIPVAQTEFAADANFGYVSERITDWVAEVGGGRPALTIPLQTLRTVGSMAVTEALLNAAPGTVIVPDAETRSDLAVIALALLEAEKHGRAVVVRSASTFAAIRAGLFGRQVANAVPGSAGRTLIVCGSHTAAASRQLKQLLTERQLDPHILRADEIIQGDRQETVDRLATNLIKELNSRRLAVLCTERFVQPEYRGLDYGERLMEALVEVVNRVTPCCDTVIAKGGITSARTATDGLKSQSAFVLGQLEPGVSLWELRLSDDRTMSYGVIPGNVGNDGTLIRCATTLGA